MAKKPLKNNYNTSVDSSKIFSSNIADLKNRIANLNRSGYNIAASSWQDKLSKAQNDYQNYQLREATRKQLSPQEIERIRAGFKKKGGAVNKVKVSAGGEKHVVYKKTNKIGKGKPGDIMVNHPTKDKGKWDTINLTKIGKAKTVKQGVAATKKWHKDNPDYKYKSKKK